MLVYKLATDSLEFIFSFKKRVSLAFRYFCSQRKQYFWYPTRNRKLFRKFQSFPDSPERSPDSSRTMNNILKDQNSNYLKLKKKYYSWGLFIVSLIKIPWFLNGFFKIPDCSLIFHEQQNSLTFLWFPGFPWPDSRKNVCIKRKGFILLV